MVVRGPRSCARLDELRRAIAAKSDRAKQLDRLLGDMMQQLERWPRSGAKRRRCNVHTVRKTKCLRSELVES